MDSDSSMDEERSHVVPIPRPAMNENESDVSDEENISRAARSIESPPESPQGTHFESPPASPDPENKPGTPSPIQSPDDSASYGSPVRSPDSQTDSRLLKIESPPKLQGSYFAKTPPPINFDTSSYRPSDLDPSSHRPSDLGISVSKLYPIHYDYPSNRYGPGDKIIPSPTNHPHPYPSSPTSNHILGIDSEAQPLIPQSPSSNQSPLRRSSPQSPSSNESPVRPRSPQSPVRPRSPQHQVRSRSPQYPVRRRSPHSRSTNQSPVQPRSPHSPSSNESPTRPRSAQSHSSNESPGRPRSPQSPSSNKFLARNLSPQSPNSNQHPVQPRSPQSPSSNRFKVRLGSPQSLSSNQSPTPGNQYGIRSPCQRSQSPNSVRSPSPYRSRRRGISPIERSRRQSSESPDRSQSSPRPSFSPRRNLTRFPQSTGQQRSRRDSNNSDDGRSNISSASSFSSPRHSPVPRPRSTPQPPTSLRVKTVAELKSHVEDLSDVSDLDSLNSMSDEPEKPQKKENGDIQGTGQEVKKEVPSLRNTSTGGLEADDTEQLDFEAEEKEEGECDVPTKAAATEAAVSEDEGELKGDELEEGEITDEGENRPEETEPRPICRFYNRGQCTWGASCRFVHPGVTDKGNYTMFEMVRPLVPVNGPPPMYGPPPMEPYRPIERPMMGPPMFQQPPQIRREEIAPVVESAWERGLRQAKEMLRKSSKRKETEVDFEEKKMNLSLGQDDLDKENDYYTRSASPIVPDETTWGGKMEGEPKRYRTMSERFDDYGGGAEGVFYPRNTEQVWHQRPHYDESMRGVYSSRGSKYYSRESREKEYYSSSSKRNKYNQREVIVQRSEKASWKDDSPPSRASRYAEGRSTGGRGDEWADPWMRSKTSPLSRKQRSRKQSYSSGSSYSSSSSSRSSRSSSSSYSRSRSRSRSSRSRSRDKPTKTKMSPPRRLLRATSPVVKGPKVSLSPALVSEKKPTTERSIMMNPPPPSPRSKPKVLATNPSPPIDRVVRPGVPARLLAHSKAASAVAAAMRSTRSGSKSSHSSSNSDSSGSSSDSSETSFSSSSSSRPASPPVRQKRIVIDERLALAQAMKVKAMDALKLSGQKQQIKLTLKGSGAGERPTPMATIAGKKRPAESPVMDFSPPKTGGKTTPKKTAPSRREELLKQLKAVEDAIARKRSKIS